MTCKGVLVRPFKCPKSELIVKSPSAIIQLTHCNLMGVQLTFRAGCPAKVDIATGSNVTGSNNN